LPVVEATRGIGRRVKRLQHVNYLVGVYDHPQWVRTIRTMQGVAMDNHFHRIAALLYFVPFLQALRAKQCLTREGKLNSMSTYSLLKTFIIIFTAHKTRRIEKYVLCMSLYIVIAL
jgi:hypothetical protein